MWKSSVQPWFRTKWGRCKGKWPVEALNRLIVGAWGAMVGIGGRITVRESYCMWDDPFQWISPHTVCV